MASMARRRFWRSSSMISAARMARPKTGMRKAPSWRSWRMGAARPETPPGCRTGTGDAHHDERLGPGMCSSPSVTSSISGPLDHAERTRRECGRSCAPASSMEHAFGVGWDADPERLQRTDNQERKGHGGAGDQTTGAEGCQVSALGPVNAVFDYRPTGSRPHRAPRPRIPWPRRAGRPPWWSRWETSARA